MNMRTRHTKPMKNTKPKRDLPDYKRCQRPLRILPVKPIVQAIRTKDLLLIREMEEKKKAAEKEKEEEVVVPAPEPKNVIDTPFGEIEFLDEEAETQPESKISISGIVTASIVGISIGLLATALWANLRK